MLELRGVAKDLDFLVNDSIFHMNSSKSLARLSGNNTIPVKIILSLKHTTFFKKIKLSLKYVILCAEKLNFFSESK